MNANSQIIVQSAVKALKQASINGQLNLKKLLLFDIIDRYIDFTENENAFVGQRSDLLKKLYDLKALYPNAICNYKTVLPRTTPQVQVPSQPVKNVEATAANITVDDIKSEPVFGVGDNFDTYYFKKSDFQSVYEDNNDGEFYSIVIYRSDLQQGTLKYNETWTSGTTFTESSIPIEILAKDISKWSYYTDSTQIYSHSLTYRIIDRVAGKDYPTSTYTITIDRSGKPGNLPATIGDNTVKVGNNATTIITLAMVTSSLTPPYNDPEGELLDAIRIVEISTANKGVMQLNGVDVTEGDIITREQLEEELLTYVSSSYTDIWGDSFRFQARDEGSGQWVD